MAYTPDEIVQDLGKAYGFYLKIKAAAANPAGLAVVPPPVAGDKADEALAIAQSLSSDFIGFVREVVAQRT